MDELQDEPFESLDDDLVGEAVDEAVDAPVDAPVDEVAEPAGPSAAFEPTGNPEVDDVLESVSQVAELPTSEHVEVYEDAHRRLHETLVSAVDRPERSHGG